MWSFMFGRFKSLFTKSADQLFSGMAILPFSTNKRSWSKQDFLSAYDISLYANRALNKRAEKVGEIEFQLLRGEEPVENHEVLDLLAKPNQAFTGPEFWALYQKYYDIFGEDYILLDDEAVLTGTRRRVNSMHLLRPDMCTPYFDKQTGRLTKIEHRTTEGTETIEGERIIYTHNPHPANPLRGESLLQSGIRQIETATQIDEYHSKVLENGGRVDGVFNFKSDNLNKTQLQEMKDAYQDQYGKASKSGLPLFLAGNATYERLGLDPAELAYLDTKTVTLNDIAMLTGTPKSILGMTSDETFANADAAIRVFLRETINPLLKNLVTKLDEDLVEDGLTLWYVDPTPEDKEEIRKDLETANTINAMTINEKREALGLDPIDNGDWIYGPMNLVPLTTNDPEEEPVRDLPESPPQPEEPEEKSVKIHHPLRDLKTRRIYHALCVKRLDRRQKQMENVVNEYFKGQQERLIENIEGRKQFKVKSLLSETFNTTLELKLAKESVLPVLEEMLKASAEDAKEIAGSDWEFNDSAEINSWLDKKTEVFAKQINETTFKKLEDEFTESLAEGETRQQLTNRIQNTYSDISKARAATIARTEVHGVTQYGTMEGYKQAGMPIKIWVWAPGTQGGVRDEHQAIDGEETDLKASFSNGLEFPGDPNGGAAEVVNCQCFI